MASNSVLTLVRDVWPEVTLVLARPWQSPQAMAAAIQLLMQSSPRWTQEVLQRIEVIGAPDQLVLCLMNDDQIFLCSPQKGSLITHPFVSELREDFHAHFEEHMLDTTSDCFTCAASERLKTRLTLPSVLLVNLFHPEMYPTCRLTLGIAYLASYLRLHHLAHVKMIDCQFYTDAEHNIIEHIVEQIQSMRPDILGISVNFGQFDMMELLLKKIYSSLAVPPLIILGNILPAMCYREILKVYPEVVICRKEGELSLAALVRYGRDRTHWNQIPGIHYLDADRQKITSTPARYLPMENLPPPALDTVPDLFRHDGVITAEFSRGCQYNQCSFCPRVHKGSIWRTIPVDSMVQQWHIFARVFQHFDHQAHVFLADEDFVGKELEGDGTLQRLTTFLDQVQHLHISFDASCRADQIFREGRDDAWHIARGRFFRHCQQRGLTRLFLGVESG